MSKYIPAEKLIDKLEKLKNKLKSLMSKFYYAANYKEWATELSGYNTVLSIITSLQQEQSDCVWIHKKYNREYRIVSDNARLKDSEGKWIDCVIYAPLYENEFEMFAREKDSFYKEFEKK